MRVWGRTRFSWDAFATLRNWNGGAGRRGAREQAQVLGCLRCEVVWLGRASVGRARTSLVYCTYRVAHAKSGPGQAVHLCWIVDCLHSGATETRSVSRDDARRLTALRSPLLVIATRVPDRDAMAHGRGEEVATAREPQSECHHSLTCSGEVTDGDYMCASHSCAHARTMVGLPWGAPRVSLSAVRLPLVPIWLSDACSLFVGCLFVLPVPRVVPSTSHVSHVRVDEHPDSS